MEKHIYEMGEWYKLNYNNLTGQNCWVEAFKMRDQKWKENFTIKLLNVNQKTIPTENYIAKLIKLEKSLLSL